MPRARPMPRIAALALLAGILATAAPAAAVTIDEFPVQEGASGGQHIPYFIVTGPDGRLWFTDVGGMRGIGRMATDGTAAGPLAVQDLPFDIVRAPDDTVYWTESQTLNDQLSYAARVVRRLASGGTSAISASGGDSNQFFAVTLAGDGAVWWTRRVYSQALNAVASFDCHAADQAAWSGDDCPHYATTASRYTDLTLGPDGKLWIASYEEGVIKRANPSTGAFEADIPLPAGSHAYRIAAGPDGRMWAADYTGDRILRITTAGTVATFQLPADHRRGPNDIVPGPDGALWFTEYDAAAIGRMTTDGTLTHEFPVPTQGSTPWGITVGPEGAIWFTESSSGKIGRLTLDKPDPGGGGGGGGGGDVRDETAPAAAKLKVRPSSFLARSKGQSIVATGGAQVTYTLTEPAGVEFRVEQARRGRKVGAKCVTQRASNRTKPACTYYKLLKGSFAHAASAGLTGFRFSGRLRSKRLTPGSYRLAGTPTDGAGNKGAAVRARFRITRPK
jgi:streptogramin lyase